jgi:hypothetical protein
MATLQNLLDFIAFLCVTPALLGHSGLEAVSQALQKSVTYLPALKKVVDSKIFMGLLFTALGLMFILAMVDGKEVTTKEIWIGIFLLILGGFGWSVVLFEHLMNAVERKGVRYGLALGGVVAFVIARLIAIG